MRRDGGLRGGRGLRGAMTGVTQPDAPARPHPAGELGLHQQRAGDSGLRPSYGGAAPSGLRRGEQVMAGRRPPPGRAVTAGGALNARFFRLEPKPNRKKPKPKCSVL
ncbi:hypothetical protein C2845_PM17G11470 [Panicum miliaceum]|uniref:Uncharacterized protein n=1 Tax=Panicum miliaceum TaxID=4540 RepID=A0A3L6Q166_PANMI|nr:hypothetical protein C2845_PM17G11470 [Panicum miliaceum]